MEYHTSFVVTYLNSVQDFGCQNNRNVCISDLYVKEIQAGICSREGEPLVEKESAATALVNGKNVLGPVVGNYCMNLALKKAQDVGIGWVVAHGK